MSATAKQLLSPLEVSEKLKNDKNVKVIDTREFESFKLGHIPGAVNIDKFFFYVVEDSSAETMATLRSDFAKTLSESGITRNHNIVTYEETMDTCNGASCRAYFLLKYFGVKKVSVLHGGFAAWKQAGLEVTTKIKMPWPEPNVFEPEVTSDLMADKKDTKAALNDPSTAIVDCRDEKEWYGIISSPYGPDYCPRKVHTALPSHAAKPLLKCLVHNPQIGLVFYVAEILRIIRKGRIPGSIWVPWLSLMEADAHGNSMFKSPEKIRDIFRKAGVKNDHDSVIIYCFKGARAANTQIAMQNAGYKNVKNYFASWNEWSRDKHMPVDSNVIAEK